MQMVSLQGMKSAGKICLLSSKDNSHYFTTANLVTNHKLKLYAMSDL